MTTNDVENPNPTLTCEGSVKAPFEMKPSLVNFGTIERDSEAQRKTIKITRGDAGPLALELGPISSENVKATLREIEAGESYELDVELVPPWPKQTIRTSLTLKTGVEQVAEEKITVHARIAQRLRVAPPRFAIPAQLVSDLDLKSRLVWSGGSPGKVVEVTSSNTGLSASVEESGGRQAIVLHVPRDFKCSPHASDYVTVKTDDKDAPSLRIQVHAAGKTRAHRTGTPGKPTIRRLPTPPGARPKPVVGKPTTAVKPLVKPTVEPAEPAKDTAEPSEKPSEKPDQPAEKPSEEPE